jgi:hypothetical protein
VRNVGYYYANGSDNQAEIYHHWHSHKVKSICCVFYFLRHFKMEVAKI